MREKTAEYLTELYSDGFDKRAAGETRTGGTGGNMALGAGIGAGLGGLGGLASYYLQDEKKRRRSSLMNRVLAGGLLGAGVGSAVPLLPSGEGVARLVQTPDGKIGPLADWAGRAGQTALHLGTTYGLAKRLASAKEGVKGLKAPGTGHALALQAARGLVGGDGWQNWLGRRALDAGTGFTLGLQRPGLSWRGRGLSALGGLAAGLFSDYAATTGKHEIQRQLM